MQRKYHLHFKWEDILWVNYEFIEYGEESEIIPHELQSLDLTKSAPIPHFGEMREFWQNECEKHWDREGCYIATHYEVENGELSE